MAGTFQTISSLRRLYWRDAYQTLKISMTNFHTNASRYQTSTSPSSETKGASPKLVTVEESSPGLRRVIMADMKTR